MFNTRQEEGNAFVLPSGFYQVEKTLDCGTTGVIVEIVSGGKET